MNEEEHGPQLLRSLAGEPVGPPGVDVSRAVRDGRRRRLGQFTSVAATLAALIAIAVGGGMAMSGSSNGGAAASRPDLPPDPAVPAACTMSRLPMGRHHSAQVTGGDESGRWLVGQVEPVAGKPHPMLVWHDGRLVADMSPPAGGLLLTGINASGVAVGGGEDESGHPYVYRDGRLSRLKGGPGRAGAINDAGVIAGTLKDGNRDVPVRWRTADAEPERLPLPAGLQPAGWILDIEADGTTVGLLAMKPVLWRPDGSVLVIPPPTTGALIRPTQIHYGWLYFENATGRDIWRYEPVTGTWQRVGDTYGKVLMPGLGVADSEASIFVGRAVLPLPLDPSILRAGMKNIQVTSISADVRVITGSAQGGNSDPSKPFQPIVWSCK